MSTSPSGKCVVASEPSEPSEVRPTSLVTSLGSLKRSSVITITSLGSPTFLTPGLFDRVKFRVNLRVNWAFQPIFSVGVLVDHTIIGHFDQQLADIGRFVPGYDRDLVC